MDNWAASIILKLCTPNNIISKYIKQNLTDTHRENDKSITVTGDFYIPLNNWYQVDKISNEIRKIQTTK